MMNMPTFKAKELLPVYALVSTEGVLVDDALVKLKEIIAKDISETNTEYFHAAEVKMEGVIQSAQTLPFLAKKRFIHIAHIEKLKAKEQDALLRYIEEPNRTTILCLSGSKIDQRTKLGKSLVKNKFLFNMSAPNQKELPKWITKRSQQQGCTLDMDAAFLLSDLIGNDLALLERAIEKAALYVHPKKEITFEVIQECVAATRLHSVFELNDAIGSRNTSLALTLLKSVIDGGENALLVLTMLARHLRQLIGLKNLTEYNLSEYDLAKEIGSRHFLIQSLKGQANNYSLLELQGALKKIGECDLQIKSSRVPPVFVLQTYIAELLEPTR